MANGISNLPTATSLGAGSKFTASSAAVQISTSTASIKRIHISAHEANTDAVVVGPSTIVAGSSGDAAKARVGIELQPGGQVSFNIDSLSKVYLRTVVTGEGVTYVYEA